MSSSNLAMPVAGNEVQVLFENKKALFDCFKLLDSSHLSAKLEEHQVIDKKSAKGFRSLDNKKVEQERKIRFLLQEVFKSVTRDSELFINLVTVLEEINKPLSVDLTHKLMVTSKVDDDSLLQEHLEILVDILSDQCAGRSRAIGIKLGISEHVLDNIVRRLNRAPENLYGVLNEWFTGKYKPVCLSQLKQALESPLVAHKVLASELKNKFHNACAAPKPQRPKLISSFRILSQSSDTEVEDGKAILFEVQTTSNETASFSWHKDSQPLPNDDSELYSGYDSAILLVHRACEATRGVYTCCINGNLTSNEIRLTVKYSEDKKHLIAIYSKLSEVSKGSSAFPTTSQFISLAMTKVPLQERKPSKYSVVKGIEGIIKKREHVKVSYRELFSNFASRALILIEGRPGSGKTTLACKITRDWATKASVLKNAKYVFLLPLRGYQDNELQVNGFQALLNAAEKSDGEGFCVIFDGLDEWKFKNNNKMDESIKSMIRGNYLSEAMVIAMSRPAAANSFRNNSTTQRVEILGFGKNEIYQYIDAYPFDQICDSETNYDDMPTKLKQYLETHKKTLHICYLPVHAAMICFLYSLKIDTMPETETQIYEYFTRSVILRKFQQLDEEAQLHSLDNLDAENDAHFKKICRLAYEMTCSSKQVVEKRQDFPINSLAPPNSLLTIDAMAQIQGIDNVITFLHLTLQEYLAARHITSLPVAKQQEVIQHHGSSEHMSTTWRFFCGINSSHEEKAALFEKLMRKVESHHLYKVECAYESQNPQLCTGLLKVESGEISFHSLSLTPTNFTAIGYVLMNSTYLPSVLEIRVCTSDMIDQDTPSTEGLESISTLASSPSDLGSVIGLAVKAFPSIVTQYLTRSERDRKSFLEKAGKTYKSLTKYDVSSFGISVDTINQLLGSSVKDANNVLTSKHSQPLMEGLSHCASNLRALNISGNVFGPQGAELLSGTLQSCGFLQKLDVSSNMIGSDGAEHLAHGLQYCRNLEVLKLSANNISREGERAIAAAIRSLPNLNDIDISWNSIGYIAFADHLNLVKLNIAGTNIKSVFRSEMPQLPPTLEKINLSYNEINSSDALVLANTLSQCPKLRKLLVSCNKIGIEGASQLIEATKASIKKIDLSNNCIGEDYLQFFTVYPDVDMDFSDNHHPESKEAGPSESKDAVKLIKSIAKDLLTSTNKK